MYNCNYVVDEPYKALAIRLEQRAIRMIRTIVQAMQVPKSAVHHYFLFNFRTMPITFLLFSCGVSLAYSEHLSTVIGMNVRIFSKGISISSLS